MILTRNRVRELFEWLLKMGVSERDALRVLKLSKRATVLRLNKREAVIAVPSQRLWKLPRAHTISHMDLLDILEGRMPRHREVVVGRLPEDQQVYVVYVRRDRATCTCPATRLGKAPLCTHRLAAAAKLYSVNRLDLLAWLPSSIRAWYKWRRSISERMKRAAIST